MTTALAHWRPAVAASELRRAGWHEVTPDLWMDGRPRRDGAYPTYPLHEAVLIQMRRAYLAQQRADIRRGWNDLKRAVGDGLVQLGEALQASAKTKE